MNTINSYALPYGPDSTANVEESERLPTMSDSQGFTRSKFYFNSSQKDLDFIKDEKPATATSKKRPTIRIDLIRGDSNGKALEVFKGHNESTVSAGKLYCSPL